MVDKTDLGTQARKLLGELENECSSKAIPELWKSLDTLEGLCVDNADTKENAFTTSGNLLDQVESDCPKSKEIVGKLRVVLGQGAGLMCGGG
ncbi:MAG: hypothetical protein GY861_24545 [bacterium]|nr:hypothetical protein [bacterium]